MRTIVKMLLKNQEATDEFLWNSLGVGSLTSNKPLDLSADPDQCRDPGVFNGIFSLRDKAVV